MLTVVSRTVTQHRQRATHQLLLLHRADHDSASLRVGGQVLPRDDPTAPCLAESLDVNRLQLPLQGSRMTQQMVQSSVSTLRELEGATPTEEQSHLCLWVDDLRLALSTLLFVCMAMCSGLPPTTALLVANSSTHRESSPGCCRVMTFNTNTPSLAYVCLFYVLQPLACTHTVFHTR